jgi:hypothetical protein
MPVNVDGRLLVLRLLLSPAAGDRQDATPAYDISLRFGGRISQYANASLR